MDRFYWLWARIHGLWCLVRMHDIEWRANTDYEPDCPGDIVCHTCNLVLWCRWYDPWRKHPSE